MDGLGPEEKPTWVPLTFITGPALNMALLEKRRGIIITHCIQYIHTYKYVQFLDPSNRAVGRVV